MLNKCRSVYLLHLLALNYKKSSVMLNHHTTTKLCSVKSEKINNLQDKHFTIYTIIIDIIVNLLRKN